MEANSILYVVNASVFNRLLLASSFMNQPQTYGRHYPNWKCWDSHIYVQDGIEDSLYIAHLKLSRNNLFKDL